MPEYETFVIDNPETLKVLADPQRLRLLSEMTDRPRTVRQLAEWLGVPKTRLYYHVKRLEEHGLIRVTDRRIVSGIEERTYEATARNWTVSEGFWSSPLVRTGVLRALMDVAGAEISLSLDREAEAGDPSRALPHIVLTRLFLSPEDVEEVQKRLGSIMDDFFERSDDRPDKIEYHALYATYKAPL
jgi:DNA-binding transcriptional ArsR family regulator